MLGLFVWVSAVKIHFLVIVLLKMAAQCFIFVLGAICKDCNGIPEYYEVYPNECWSVYICR